MCPIEWWQYQWLSLTTNQVFKVTIFAQYCFIRKRNEPYLPLPPQPHLVLIYRSRRDGRLSWSVASSITPCSLRSKRQSNAVSNRPRSALSSGGLVVASVNGQKGRRTKRPGDGKACLFDAPRTRRRDCVWMISILSLSWLLLIKKYYASFEIEMPWMLIQIIILIL